MEKRYTDQTSIWLKEAFNVIGSSLPVFIFKSVTV